MGLKNFLDDVLGNDNDQDDYSDNHNEYDNDNVDGVVNEVSVVVCLLLFSIEHAFALC
jgi:hypothetical protein